MPLELLHTIGTGMFALGFLILASKLLHQVIGVLAPAGSMTLTLYSGHLLFLSGDWLGDHPFASFGFQVAAALIFGIAWRNAVGRGPLEAAVTSVATRAKNAVLKKARTKEAATGSAGSGPGAAGPRGPDTGAPGNAGTGRGSPDLGIPGPAGPAPKPPEPPEPPTQPPTQPPVQPGPGGSSGS